MRRRTPALLRAPGLSALVAALACTALAACKDKRDGGSPDTAPAARPTPTTGQPDGDTGPVPATQAAAPAPEVRPATVTYEDSIQGLESLMGQLVKAIQDDQPTEEARLLASLRLPDPPAWFHKVFDAPVADWLVAEYAPLSEGIGYLQNVLKPLINSGQTAVKVEKFDRAKLTAEVGYQSEALARMRTPVPLYSVRLTTPDGHKTFHLWSFVYEDGTFRYVGKMRAVLEHPPKTDKRDLLEYRLRDVERVKAMDAK